MKIQGRFIAILAVLGLLIALVPLASVGAVTGEVTLSGGAGGFFSDRSDYNIVTIQVKDSDISPTRKGTARLDLQKATPGEVDLSQFFVSGEKDKTEKFDGGVNDVGDATKGGTTDAPTYTFSLKSIARDIQAPTSDDESEVAVINEKDIKSVVVNGVEVDAVKDPVQTEGAYYRVTPLAPCAFGQECAGSDQTVGGGIKDIILHRIIPQDRADSVSITFRETEFGFGPATPLSTASTAVHGGTTYFGSSASVTVGGADSPNLTFNAPVNKKVIVTFYYDVKDTAKGFAKLNSASAGERELDGGETTAASSKFEAKVAIFSRSDHTKIRTEAGATENDDGDLQKLRVEDAGVVNIDELITALEKTDVTTGAGALSTRVGLAATELDFTTHDIDKAEDLLEMIIPGTDGDVINVTYADTNPAVIVSKAVTVDMAAPAVNLVSPSDNLFTNTGTATFVAEVTDTGAGVNQSDIGITAGAVGLSEVVPQPIVNGYRLTAASQVVISEGAKTWYVVVEDKVGNVPARDDVATTDVNEAPKGSTTNPYKFTVDTRAPTLLSGKTGLYLKNPGVTSGDDADKEDEKTNGGQWVRALFDLGGGGAPLDATTISANDFRVAGAAPIDVKINALKHDDTDSTAEAAKGAAVYLQVGSLDTDAKPKVELVGEVRDTAGNIRTDGRIAASADGLAPVLTVTPSADIAEEEVTITVSSSERLRSNPTVNVTTTKPEDSATTGLLLSAGAVSAQTGSLTTWTATHKASTNKYYVVVEATDQNDNTAKVGVAANEDDLVSYQLDDKAPALKFVDAAREDLEATDQEEGAVWIVAEFDEDEHEGDKYRKVEVTAVTLMNMDSDEVVTEDVSMLFGSEVACVDPDDADRDNKCAQWTLAVNLTPGMYNVAVTGVDATGNEVTGNTDFKVTEAKPFELTLRPGQNFISIKGMPMGDGGMLDNLFSDPAITAVSTYDRSLELQGANPWLRASKDLETGMFSGDITMIEPGKAYFVSSSASVTVKVKLQPPGELPPTIPVRQGYNAIGFWSISGADNAEFDLYLNSIGWSLAYSYDPTPGKGWEVIRKGELDSDDNPRNIEAGKGYLVYATYDAVLTP